MLLGGENPIERLPLAASRLHSLLQLRFVHEGSPFDAALLSLVAKLGYGASRSTLMRYKSATSGRWHVVDR